MSNGPMERHQDVTLLEVVDRVIDKGVVLSGDIVLSVADIDLVYVGLRLLIASQDTARRLKSEAALAATSS
jgi:gas vesicle structural protein